jgi:hypothetical protein
MTTMIALVGGQPQLNLIPILHYRPNNAVFVYTATTREKYENLKIALEKWDCHIYGIETDPYDIAAITSTLNKLLAEMAELSQQPMIFNLTGGTKIMSLAACQVAAQYNAPVIYLQSERGGSIVDLYNWQGHQLTRQQQEWLPEYLDLRDVLDLHLGQGKDATGKKRWEEKGSYERGDEGHLFERAIAQVLTDHDYEVMCGVSDPRHQIDIDIMIRYQNQIGILEVKASQSTIGLNAVKQLSIAMRYLGGIYIRPFLVTNGQARYDLQATCDILRIPIISLPGYRQGADSLFQEDSTILLTAIDRIMKEGNLWA